MCRKSSNHDGYFYCLNCLHSFRTENKLKSHERACKDKDFCSVEIPSEKKSLLKFGRHMKSEKMPYIIYTDLECLVKRIEGCEDNPEVSSTTKTGENIPCGYSMSTIWRFDHINDQHTLYRGQIA